MGLQQEKPEATKMRTGELDTIAETTTVEHRRHRDVSLETRAYFDNFMAISEEVTRPQYEKQESLALDLDFSCTDIEADGLSPSTDHGGDETDSSDSAESDSASDVASGGDKVREGDSEMEEKEKRFRDGGRALREMADRIDKEYLESNPTAGAELSGFIINLTQQAADNAFEHTIDKVLEHFNGSFPQHDDKYKVAMVMLCTRRSIIAMNSALNYTKETSERVIGNAMSYIAGHYPGWIDNFR